MKPTRREFTQTTIGAGLAAVGARWLPAAQRQGPTYEELDRAAAAKVLHVESLTSPVKIESMELLRNGGTFLVRVRSTDGAEGLAIPNPDRLGEAYPIFLGRIAPFFIGEDARELERLLWDLYRHSSNYKLQGLAFWACQAAAEFGILDLLGKLTGKSIGGLLGGTLKRDIAVYRASGHRGNTPEEEIEYLKQLVDETGAGAVKFRLGGRMSKNKDSLPGRSEKLIPLVREALGPEMTIYADANSSYDAQKAIQIGRLMEEYDYAFFEEPCPFDHLEETKQVADALTMPVAGGEQEFSHRRFRWMIYNRGVDIVQPDLHYYGGYIRSMRVARMAEAAGMLCTPHMSNSGLGYLDLLHFVSCIPNAGRHHEFKGRTRQPVTCETSSLNSEEGLIRVPSGAGFGITIDPDFVRQAKRVTAM